MTNATDTPRDLECLPPEFKDGGQFKWSHLRPFMSFSGIRSFALMLLPSPLSGLWEQSRLNASSPAATEFLNGVRGIGALMVYTQHFLTPFHSAVIGDVSRQENDWSYLQYPIIRLFYHGSFAVAIFFVLSGYALSWNYYQARQQRNPRMTAIDILASAAFRRGVRLFLPALTIVFIMITMASFGAFDHPILELPVEHYDLRVPQQARSFTMQLADGLAFVLSQLLYPNKWMKDIPLVSAQIYGFHLWTISVEFWASQFLFSVLFITYRTSTTTRRYSLIVIAIYSIWSLRWELSLFMVGSLISDYSSHRSLELPFTSRSNRLVRCGIGGLCCIGGMWTGSMPDFNADVTPGFRYLSQLMFEESVWHSVGAALVVGSLSICEPFQAVFRSSWMQYLGSISFSVYLVHVPILASFGWPIVQGLRSITSSYSLTLEALGYLLLLALVLWIADIFWRFVDSPCILLAKRLDTVLATNQEIM